MTDDFDPMLDIRRAVASVLREYSVNCSHAEFTNAVIDLLPASVRHLMSQGNAVDMLFEMSMEHHDRVLGLCPNGPKRWDVVDVIKRPYSEDSPDSEWRIGTAATPQEAVFNAGRNI